LADAPFGFFRGTFHLFVHDFHAADLGPLTLRPQALVGDAHLENLGAYRALDGQVVFDVNDFDDAGKASPLLDLARFATSIVLARPTDADHHAVARIAGFVDGWRHAVAGRKEEPWPRTVRALMSSAAEVRRGDWLKKRVETTRSGQRRFKVGKTADAKYQRVLEPALRTAIAAAVVQFGRSCQERPYAGWPQVLDVASRRAGTGSLGRHRWAVLVAGNKPGAKERVLELKEALPSLLGPNPRGTSARRIIALQRSLQAAPPAFLGAARIDRLSYTVRELQPTELRIRSSDPDLDLAALCHASGGVLGRLHRRGAASGLPIAACSERSLVRLLSAFALRYAETVSADHAQFCAALAEVRAALSLTRDQSSRDGPPRQR
jgi:uncharacterized protein (DUF2252 family)